MWWHDFRFRSDWWLLTLWLGLCTLAGISQESGYMEAWLLIRVWLMVTHALTWAVYLWQESLRSHKAGLICIIIIEHTICADLIYSKIFGLLIKVMPTKLVQWEVILSSLLFNDDFVGDPIQLHKCTTSYQMMNSPNYSLISVGVHGNLWHQL